MRFLSALLFLAASACASARPDIVGAGPNVARADATSAAAHANRGPDVAFANLTVAVRECRDGQKAREELMRTYSGYQEHLDRRQQQLAAEQAQIAARRARGENVEAREAAFQRRVAEAQEERENLQKGLSQAEQRRADRVRERLKIILRDLARARAISEVVDADSPPNDGRHYIDLTADVIRQADQSSENH
jgi:Skp family chaperone for outer membrane proteins